MLRYIAHRLGLALISIAGVVVVVFLITYLLPGDAARTQAGQYATEEQIQALRVQYGLDRALPVQFWNYLVGVVQFDFGQSIRTQGSVTEELLDRLPASLELSLGALLIALVVGIVLGALAARSAGGVTDGAVRGFALLASSTATFWVGLMAVLLFCNILGWFPSPVGRLPRGYDAPDTVTGSYVVDALLAGDPELAGVALRSIALPCLVLGLVVTPSIIKNVRSSTIRALDSDFTRTSRLFGYGSTSILFRDGLRNSLLPVLTGITIVAGYLLGGNIIIEQIFSWPGIGQYAYQALQSHDLNALRGFALLVGIIYVLLNTVLDILYTVVDPRVRTAPAARRTRPSARRPEVAA
ncbi:ABC transporter permease [Nakamurella alba]|uniref:ABC transporter permease n=1 Tax=Nakamurella alba TaxID=2665158 RepID=UPI0012B84445|nr:ABC transporter permease [Nakamurella alba]